jgi:hypothetical protein
MKGKKMEEYFIYFFSEGFWADYFASIRWFADKSYIYTY